MDGWEDGWIDGWSVNVHMHTYRYM